MAAATVTVAAAAAAAASSEAGAMMASSFFSTATRALATRRRAGPRHASPQRRCGAARSVSGVGTGAGSRGAVGCDGRRPMASLSRCRPLLSPGPVRDAFDGVGVGVGAGGQARSSFWEPAGDVVRSVQTDFRPRRIILLRHGESQGNVDDAAYVTTPDWLVPLTDRGLDQASAAGESLRDLLLADTDADTKRGLVSFYHSPYLRTRQTLDRMLDVLSDSGHGHRVVAVREEPRISEQQFGNFQNVQEVLDSKKERHRFGRFYYRFSSGEAGLDVYSRVSSFITTLVRDCHMYEHLGYDLDSINVVIVTHGLSLRLFLMRWFQWTVSEFEQSQNPDNAKLIVMNKRRRSITWSNEPNDEKSMVVDKDSLSLGMDGTRKMRQEKQNKGRGGDHVYYELDPQDRQSMGLPECCGVPRNVTLHRLAESGGRSKGMMTDTNSDVVGRKGGGRA